MHNTIISDKLNFINHSKIHYIVSSPLMSNEENTVRKFMMFELKESKQRNSCV